MQFDNRGVISNLKNVVFDSNFGIKFNEFKVEIYEFCTKFCYFK